MAYPNPTHDALTVNLDFTLPKRRTATDASFTLTDVMGRKQETAGYLTVLDGRRIKLSVRHLPVGVYRLRIGGNLTVREDIQYRTVRFVKE